MGRTRSFEGTFGTRTDSEEPMPEEQALEERIASLALTVSEDPELLTNKQKKDLELIIKTFDTVYATLMEQEITIQNVVSIIEDMEQSLKSGLAKNILSNLIKREKQISIVIQNALSSRLNLFEQQAQQNELDETELQSWATEVSREFKVAENKLLDEQYQMLIAAREWFEHEANDRISKALRLKSESAA